jgi:glycosyltransferase involved in cell wall biosynthesis
MILIIDASNIRGGGGVTHLVEVLNTATPEQYGFSSVYVCSGKRTLDRIADRPWLIKYHHKKLDMSLFHRVSWQFFDLKKLAQLTQCGLLFVPGGTYFGNFHPFVSMSQNLLPFEWTELRRYGLSMMTLKLILLRFTQSITFRRSDGIIFLTDFAKQSVLDVIKKPVPFSATIPHGINTRFSNPPKEQKPINEYSNEKPFRILYVSSVDVYKHQGHVIEAVSILYKMGLPVFLDLVGPADLRQLSKLQNTLAQLDPNKKFVNYHGSLPYESLSDMYAKTNLSVFASSCETFGQIVTEAMSAGLPIACSNLSALPDVLGDAGLYFNPEDSNEIAATLQRFIENPSLRAQKAMEAFNRSQSYSWRRCANETFEFLQKVASLQSNTQQGQFRY